MKLLTKVNIYRSVTLLLLLACLWPDHAFSENNKRVLLIKTSNRDQYNTAAEGLKSVFMQSQLEIGLEVHTIITKGQKKKVKIELEKKGIDLVITLGTDALNFIKKNRHYSTPVVYTMVMKAGRTPLENATGISLTIPLKIWFDTLEKIVPGLKDIGMIYNPDNSEWLIKRTQKAARDRGLQIIKQSVYSQKDIRNGLKVIKRKADVLWAIADSTILNDLSVKQLLTFTLKNKIPFFTVSPMIVRAGALFSISSDYKSIGIQSGELALKVLSGTSVSDLPETGPDVAVFSVNLNTVRMLRIDFPDSLLKKVKNVYSAEPYTIHLGEGQDSP